MPLGSVGMLGERGASARRDWCSGLYPTDLAGGGPPTPHPRVGGRCRQGVRRHLVRVRRLAPLPPLPDRRFPLPGRSACRPHQSPRRSLRRGIPRYSRTGRGLQAVAASVLDPPARDRAPDGGDLSHLSAVRRSGSSCHPCCEGRCRRRCQRAWTATALGGPGRRAWPRSVGERRAARPPLGRRDVGAAEH